MAREDGSIRINTQIDTTGVTSGVQEMQGKFNALIGSAKKLAVALGVVFSVREIVRFSKECIELGSSLTEVQNVVDVTFGTMSERINEWSKAAATGFGMSELSAKQYASTMGAMLKSMGFAGNELTDMSIKMAELAGDMASFYNLDTDVAFQKIRSGISGEIEPLKQLGVNLSEANLEQFRLSEGMTTAYNKMTQQQKALLRYNYLLKVTSDAQGDFARTSQSWANQTRILSLQFQSIKADIGQGLINVLTPVIRVINTILSGLAKMASAFKAFTALLTGTKPDQTATPQVAEGYENTANALGDVTEATKKATDATNKNAQATKKAQEENNRYTSGLDKINQYQTKNTDTSTTTPKTKATATPADTSLSNVDFGNLAKGETAIDKVDKKMQALLNNIKTATKPALDALKNLYENGLKKVGQFSWKALQDFYSKFLVPVGKWVLGKGFPEFVNALNNGLMKVNWDRLNKALSDFWEALAPFAVHVGEGLLWLWKNVLVPLGTWTANEVVPRFFRTLSTVLNIVNTVIEAAQPGWQWFWDNVLLPIAKWTGAAFLKAWDLVNKALSAFAEWCRKNPKVIENATVFITAFFTALAGMAVISSIVNVIKRIGEFIAIVKTVISMLNPWTIAIAAVIAVGVLLWKNWDTISKKAKEIWGAVSAYLKRTWETMKRNASSFISTTKSVFQKGWNAVKSSAVSIWKGIGNGLAGIWKGISSNASSIWKGINTTFSNVLGNIGKTFSSKWGAIKTSLASTWKSISYTASTAWDSVSTSATSALKSIGNAASSVGKGIGNALKNGFREAARVIKKPINGIIGLINGMISGIVSGVNAVTGTLNKLKIKIPSWVPRYGGKTLGFDIPRMYATQIPYLAQGAVIPPNAPFVAMLGDQKQGNNIETPEKLLRKIVREESGANNNNNNRYEFKAVLNRRVIFDQVIEEARLRQQMSGKNPFEFA